VHRVLLGQLTRAEAADALRVALHRHPALSFSVQASGDDGPFYSVAIEEEDFDRYRDIVNAIIPEMRPLRLRVRAVEAELADLVMRLLGSPAPWTVDAEPVREIGTLFEWRIVPYVLDYGAFIDGFASRSIEPFERPNTRGVALIGACFFFRGGPDEFEAELGVSDDGALSHLALRFGDARFAAIDRKVIPQDAPDVVERIAHGYRTVVRKHALGRSEEDGERWAFLIAKP
jgi:hypothetical protein